MALLSELAAMLVFVAVTLYKELTTKSGSVEIPARIPSLILEKKISKTWLGYSLSVSKKYQKNTSLLISLFCFVYIRLKRY